MGLYYIINYLLFIIQLIIFQLYMINEMYYSIIQLFNYYFLIPNIIIFI